MVTTMTMMMVISCCSLFYFFIFHFYFLFNNNGCIHQHCCFGAFGSSSKDSILPGILMAQTISSAIESMVIIKMLAANSPFGSDIDVTSNKTNKLDRESAWCSKHFTFNFLNNDSQLQIQSPNVCRNMNSNDILQEFIRMMQSSRI